MGVSDALVVRFWLDSVDGCFQAGLENPLEKPQSQKAFTLIQSLCSNVSKTLTGPGMRWGLL